MNKNKNIQCHKQKKEKGFLKGVGCGLIPHIGCIGFILFSILGVTAATAIFRPFLLNPYFFHILIAISVIFATISAMLYLKKGEALSFEGVKNNKGYLFTLYGSTVTINLLLFMIIFPIAANISTGSGFTTAILQSFGRGEKVELTEGTSRISLKVDIPCPGHAPLISGEVNRIEGVKNISFRFPDYFDVTYDIKKTSKDDILDLEIFQTYKALVVEEEEGVSSLVKEKKVGDEIVDKEEEITIPLAEIKEEAQWYEYEIGDKEISFFVVKGDDGKVRVAFDSCDVCYYSEKGYYQEGDYMVCENCGNRYPIIGLGEENKTSGGCWPGYLTYSIDDESIIIRTKDLIDNIWRAL
jgi:hypothetical protein